MSSLGLRTIVLPVRGTPSFLPNSDPMPEGRGTDSQTGPMSAYHVRTRKTEVGRVVTSSRLPDTPFFPSRPVPPPTSDRDSFHLVTETDVTPSDGIGGPLRIT